MTFGLRKTFFHQTLRATTCIGTLAILATSSLLAAAGSKEDVSDVGLDAPLKIQESYAVQLGTESGARRPEKLRFERQMGDDKQFVFTASYWVDRRLLTKQALPKELYERLESNWENIYRSAKSRDGAPHAPVSVTACSQPLSFVRTMAAVAKKPESVVENKICIETLSGVDQQAISKWWIESRRILGI